MKRYLSSLTLVWSVFVLGFTIAAPPAQAHSAAAVVAAKSPSASPEEDEEIAKEAYVYLYPLILMDITRKHVTNMPAQSLVGGPANTFQHIRAYPTADMRTVVRTNFDTLYSHAWIDLSNGPVVVSTAATGGRYFMLPMLDMWTDVFAAPGKRTSGAGAASFVLIPEGWRGSLPRGLEPIIAPTPYVWIIGRTQANGPKDYEAVHKIQDGYKVTRLADWGKPPRPMTQKIDPTADTKTEPLQQINKMPALQYFAYGAKLMETNPPHMTDWSILARMKRIGLEPGHFDRSKLSAAALAKAAADGLQMMRTKASTLVRIANGWQMSTDTMGVYGNYYLKRAIIAMIGLGANQPEDAIYPLNVADAEGKPVMAEHQYVLHFEKDQLPPVDAFWSLTMYDAAGFQVANPLNRFAIGDRDALKFNADGSLDLYIQNTNPGADKASNWLPAPAQGKLGLTMRLYMPQPQALDGRWNPPAIKRVD